MKTGTFDKTVYGVLFLIALALTLFSSYTPLRITRMHIDSSVYMTIAQGITRGFLPYRDFVDNKGPLEYLISVPGLALTGFTGVWLTELLLMWVSVFFSYKTALFFAEKYFALIGTALAFSLTYPFFYVNAGTEEYALPFLMVSLYLFTKYFFSPERKIAFFELIVLGFCFACAVLIRLNMFPLWAGFCAVIFVEEAVQKRFAALAKYVIGFIAGILIASIPVYLYLKLNGIYDEFLRQVVLGGAAKGFSGFSIKETAKEFFVVINRNFSFVPLFYGVFRVVTGFMAEDGKKENAVYYLGYTFSYFLMVLFLAVSPGDSHYNMVLIPYYVPAVSFFAERIYREFLNIKHRKLCFVFFACVVCSEGVLKYIDDALGTFKNDSGKQLIRAGKMIDENTNETDAIISLGINGYIYPFTKRNAASKYFFQGSGNDLIPGSREAFLRDILSKKPAIIAIFTAEDNGSYGYLPGWYAPVLEMIERDYRLLSDENGYVLFKKTN
jgi:hypothetical protein